MPVLKVRKKDGSLQDFDREKVVSGIIKSGASSEEAEKITKQIETWLLTVAVNGVVPTMIVREKILDVLKVINPGAAANFETYRKAPSQ